MQADRHGSVPLDELQNVVSQFQKCFYEHGTVAEQSRSVSLTVTILRQDGCMSLMAWRLPTMTSANCENNNFAKCATSHVF